MVDGDFERLLGSLAALLPAQLVMLDAAVRGQMARVAAVIASAAPLLCEAAPASPAPAPLQVTPMATPSIAAIEARFAQAPACPHCASQAIKKWGSANRLKRYRCKQCGVTFNALTETPLARLHKRELWGGHAQALVEGISLRKVAARLDMHLETAFHWRHRFLLAPKDLKPKALTGTVEADETYFLYSQKGARDLTRPARKRGGKAKKRGLSHEQVPVLIARDRHNATTDQILDDRSTQSIAAVLGAGRRQDRGAGQRWRAGLPGLRQSGGHRARGAEPERGRADLRHLPHPERQPLRQSPEDLDAPLQRCRHQVPRQLSRLAAHQRSRGQHAQREHNARCSLGMRSNIIPEQRQSNKVSIERIRSSMSGGSFLPSSSSKKRLSPLCRKLSIITHCSL